MSVWQTPSGRTRRWVRRKETSIPAPLYARLTILILLIALTATVVWYGVRSLWHRVTKDETAPTAETAPTPRLPSSTASWQSDALASIESGIRDAQGGNITASEVAIDRAASMIEVARVESATAAPDFFETASRSLDRAIQTQPESSRLFEHVTMARIDLAQLRSAQLGRPTESTRGSTAAANRTAEEQRRVGGSVAGSAAIEAASSPKDVTFASPREIAANRRLDPAALGGDTIDATLMPKTLEILLPPSSRLFVDNVQVQNLTMKGASQTLDGIHWKNVTFIDTRLRYESGELDLQNVHFLNCTFGVPTDQRGARFVNAIVLGQSSITIE